MKTIITLFLLTLTSYGFAQTADEKAVMEAEKQRFEAQVARKYDVLEKVLADDLIYTHSSGNTDGKQSFIQSLREGKSLYDAIDVKEQKVRVYGKTAVVNGVAFMKVTSNGQTNDLRLRYTDVYVKNGKQWQMVTWQSLRLMDNVK